MAKAIVNSPLVKTAVHGADPNWGRVAMAIGKCQDDTDIDQERVVIRFGDREVYPTLVDDAELAELSTYLRGDEVRIHVSLGTGDAAAHGLGLRPHRRLRPHQRRLHDLTRPVAPPTSGADVSRPLLGAARLEIETDARPSSLSPTCRPPWRAWTDSTFPPSRGPPRPRHPARRGLPASAGPAGTGPSPTGGSRRCTRASPGCAGTARTPEQSIAAAVLAVPRLVGVAPIGGLPVGHPAAGRRSGRGDRARSGPAARSSTVSSSTDLAT